METVTVSPKYQIVIPRSMREAMGIKPGQKIRLIRYNNVVHLIPVRPIEEARGFLKGIDTTIEREPDRF
jgi:AbrB family looped-hinge helix DNA binding protein